MEPYKRDVSNEVYRRLLKLTIVGAAAFWATNLVISWTPFAAEYRAALSISYLPMLVESLFGGLIIGLFVSFSLIRFYGGRTTGGPIQKSLILSSIALLFVTIVIEGPSLIQATSDSLHYFLVGTMINALRILALGISIGYVYNRLE